MGRFLRFKKAKFRDGGSVRVFGICNFQVVALENSDGVKLYQYGKKGESVKFVCILPKNNKKLPLFLMSSSWHRIYDSSRIIAGRVRRPKDFESFWGR